VKEDDGDDELKEKEKKWGIGGAVKYGLVPFQYVRVRQTGKSRE
jgi:hypothetical protein